jgi:hypothetical protein
LRRQLREALPESVKGLPRAVALEIADDARWDDGWRYNPEAGRRSKATLSDLVRWTAAKNERVVRDALRNLALAGWEFRVPFGKGADGRLLYAVPGRAAEFRVPDFEAPLIETEETVVTVSSSSPETVATAEEAVTTARETVTTAYEAVTTVSEAVVTGPPSHVSKSHQDPPSSPAEVSDDEPAVEPDVTDGGGGGGSDLRSIAEHITASLDYCDQVPDKQQQAKVTTALLAALEKGWSMRGLARYLLLDGYRPDNPVAFYLSKLSPKKLPDMEPAESSAAPFRGGVRGPMPTAAEYEALTVDTALFGDRPAAPAETWAEASANARRRMAGVGARSGTDATVAGWDAVKRELAGHKPYSNPEDDSVYDEPWTVPAPSRPPWCGDPGCNETDRMRDGVGGDGLPHVYRCPLCHPDRARAA